MSTDQTVADFKRSAQATHSIAFTLQDDGMVTMRVNGEIVETLTVEELLKLGTRLKKFPVSNCGE